MYNSTTKTYSTLATTATFNSNAYYAYYTIPQGTPNNTLLQFNIGTNSSIPTYYGVVQSATVLPLIFKDFIAVFNELSNNVSLK